VSDETAGSDTAAGLFATRGIRNQGSDTAAGLFASIHEGTRGDSCSNYSNPIEKRCAGELEARGDSALVNETNSLSQEESVQLASVERRVNSTLLRNGMPSIVIWNGDQNNVDEDSPCTAQLTTSICDIFELYLERTVEQMENRLWAAVSHGDTNDAKNSSMVVASGRTQLHELIVFAWNTTSHAVAAQFAYVESRWGIQATKVIVSQLRSRIKAHSGSEFSDIMLILVEQQTSREGMSPTLDISEDSARRIVQKAREACAHSLEIATRLSRSSAPIVPAIKVESHTADLTRAARTALSLVAVCNALKLWQHADRVAAKDTPTLLQILFQALYLVCLRLAWHVQDFRVVSQLIDPSVMAPPFNARFLKCGDTLLSSHYSAPESRRRVLVSSRGDEDNFSRWVTDYVHLVLEQQQIAHLDSSGDDASQDDPFLLNVLKSSGTLLDAWRQETLSRVCGRTQPAWFFSRVYPARRAVALQDRIDKVFNAAIAEATKISTMSSRSSALWKILGGLQEIEYSRKNMIAVADSIITRPLFERSTGTSERTESFNRVRTGLDGEAQLPLCIEIVRLGRGHAIKDVCLDATDASFSRIAVVGPSIFLEPNITASLQFRRRHEDFTTLADEEHNVYSASMRSEADRNSSKRSRLSKKLRNILGDGTNNHDILSDDPSCGDVPAQNSNGGSMVLPMARMSTDSLKLDIFTRCSMKYDRHDLDREHSRRTLNLHSPSRTKDVERPSCLSAHRSIPMFLSGCAVTGKVFLWRFGRNEAVQQYRTVSSSKKSYIDRFGRGSTSTNSGSISSGSGSSYGSNGSIGNRENKVTSGINKIRFSSSSDRFGAVDCSGRLHLWHFATDPACRYPYTSILCDSVSATDLAFVRGSSSVVATIGEHKKTSLCVWDTLLPVRSRLVAALPGLGAQTGSSSASTECGGITSLLSLPLGGNENTLVAGGSDGSIKIFDIRALSRGPCLRSAMPPPISEQRARHGNRIESMSYCLRSGRLATASRDGAVFVWDNILGGEGNQTALPAQRHSGSSGSERSSTSRHQGVLWLENGKLMTWGEDGYVMLYL
jgi:hypothetical protein